MFRSVEDSKRKSPNRKTSDPWEASLRPHLFETSLEPGDFNADLVDTIESLDRELVMYSLSETQRIDGVGDGCYEMVFDSNMHGSDGPRPMTYYVGVREGKRTHTAITLPDSGAIEKRLEDLKESQGGLRGVSDNLVERIKAFDGTRKSSRPKPGRHNMRKLYKCLEPEEAEMLHDYRDLFHQISQDAYAAQGYFTQMASLVSTGYFADNESLRFASGILGLRDDGKHSVFNDQLRSGRPEAKKMRARAGKVDCTDELKAILNEPWYQSDELQRNLKWPELLRQMDALGQVWRHAREIGASATRLSKDPTEGIISELYGALTGDEPTRDESLIDRIDTIAQAADAQEALNPLRDVYYSDGDKVGVSNIRNGGTHASTQLLENYSRGHDTWAALFYHSLAKTALTSLTDNPRPYFEHDAYARENRLMVGDKPVVTVDLDIAQHHKKDDVGNLGLEMV